MNDKILHWFIHGETGISSKAMAAVVAGFPPNERDAMFNNHPFDAADFRRCVEFLRAVPEAREHMDRVAALSATWANLVEHWDEWH